MGRPPYLLVELTVDEVSPAFVVFARSVFGACVLVLRSGRPRLLRGRAGQVLWPSLLDLAAPALLITIGLAAVPSSPAGTLVASEPIMVAVLALRGTRGLAGGLLVLGSARAPVVTYLAPAVAVLCGVLLLDEPLTTGIVAGLFLVLAGSRLSSGRRPPPLPLTPAAPPRRGSA